MIGLIYANMDTGVWFHPEQYILTGPGYSVNHLPYMIVYVNRGGAGYVTNIGEADLARRVNFYRVKSLQGERGGFVLNHKSENVVDVLGRRISAQAAAHSYSALNQSADGLDVLAVMALADGNRSVYHGVNTYRPPKKQPTSTPANTEHLHGDVFQMYELVDHIVRTIE